MKNIYIYQTACQRRSLDAYKIRLYFYKNNYNIVEKPEKADIIVYISCAVVKETTESALEIVKKLQKYDAELIVGGCLPEIPQENWEIFLMNILKNGVENQQKKSCFSRIIYLENFFIRLNRENFIIFG